MLSNKKLNLCLEKIEGAAYVLDKDAKITCCNNSFLQLAGFEIDEVVGKTINQIDTFASQPIHQNNVMLMSSETENSSILEFIKSKKELELFQSQKKVIRDESGKVAGLLSVSKKYEPQKQHDIVSVKTKHELREVLNALIGYNQSIAYMDDTYDSKLAINFKKIVDKLNKIISKTSVEGFQGSLLGGSQKHWCKVLWISDSIASFVFQPEENGLMIERVDSTVALNPKNSDQLFNNQYQIILVDEALLDSLPCDLEVVAESSLIVKVSEGQSPHKNKDRYITEVNHKRLIDEYKTYLPEMWQSYVYRKTIEKVSNSGVLRILSIEDDQDSQNALRQLLKLHDFIEAEFCSDAKSAQDMISEYEFDLIILDLGLPDTPGYDLALWIRNIQKQKGDFLCSIIANTGHEFSPGDDEIFKRGINQLFRKPELLRSLDTTIMHYVPKDLLSECV